jgi:methionine salvage enolase-phosphatase E1
MLEKLAQYALSFLIEKLISFITKEWEEYKVDQTKRKEVTKKVKAIKDAKTKDEIRNAIRDLSI